MQTRRRAKLRPPLGSQSKMSDPADLPAAPRPCPCPSPCPRLPGRVSFAPLAARRAPLSAALLLTLASAACDPVYEPPPKAPASVYIPWNAGPARGARRATGAPTAAPSVAPSVELEEIDDPPAPSASAGPASSGAGSASVAPPR